MNLKLIIAHVLGFITLTSFSQIQVDVHQFKTSDGSPYLDVIIDIPGENCDYKKILEYWQSTTNITRQKTTIKKQSGLLHSTQSLSLLYDFLNTTSFN